MITELSKDDRIRLLKFVCSFAWADLQVQDEERDFLRGLIESLGLSDQEGEMVDAWLQVPPRPEEIDPTEIPPEHRQLFIDTVRGMIQADNEVAEGEYEIFDLFEQLVG